MADNDQNEPQQIDRPSQYPTATRIDNGVAYDVAGKVLGNVDENQLAPSAQAAQPSQAPSASQQDPLASLGGVLVASAESTPQKQAAKPQSQPGFLERAVTSVANATGVPSLINAIGADKIQHAAETTGDVLLKAFGAPGTFGGETLKDIASQPTALKQIWRAGEIALNPIMSRGGAYPAANISQFMGKTPSIIEDNIKKGFTRGGICR